MLAALPGAAGPTSEADALRLLADGVNPYPVRLKRPPAEPLSAMAELGREIFYDSDLSASGQMSCATCHSPADHYGPPGDAPAMLGGPKLDEQGVRPPPSLTYLERRLPFSVGPDKDEDEGPSVSQQVALALGAKRASKTAATTAVSAVNLVPQGGLFWDGRVDTLQQQAIGPMLNPLEMANTNAADVAARLQRSAYAHDFVALFGARVLDDPKLLLSEAMFALARYQIEEPSFHPYDSKFDAWLEGRARFTPAEMRGYLAFNDPAKGDCGACHVDEPTPDGLPPAFTDGQFEALAAPRNPVLAVNRDSAYYDLGLCGPYREDLSDQKQYCGMFTTPTLRNVATRKVFFHNGVFRSLAAVLDFYDFRDVDPAMVYPKGADGEVLQFDDIPPAFSANVDTTDPPFDRKAGDKPAMSESDEKDIIAFLNTLTDGYRP